jgi:hypothetical protein
MHEVLLNLGEPGVQAIVSSLRRTAEATEPRVKLDVGDGVREEEVEREVVVARPPASVARAYQLHVLLRDRAPSIPRPRAASRIALRPTRSERGPTFGSRASTDSHRSRIQTRAGASATSTARPHQRPAGVTDVAFGLPQPSAQARVNWSGSNALGGRPSGQRGPRHADTSHQAIAKANAMAGIRDTAGQRAHAVPMQRAGRRGTWRPGCSSSRPHKSTWVLLTHG